MCNKTEMDGIYQYLKIGNREDAIAISDLFSNYNRDRDRNSEKYRNRDDNFSDRSNALTVIRFNLSKVEKCIV